MFDRFTDRARHVADLALDLADEQADPEHILLAIGLEGQGIGAVILDRLGVPALSATPAARRSEVQFSERSLTVFALARSAAEGHVGTEHLLLGVIDESGPASQTLAAQGITGDRTRAEIAAYLGKFGGPPTPKRPSTPASLAIEIKIASVRAEKWAAIEADDFDQAANLRDQEKALLQDLAALELSESPGLPT